MKFFFCSSNDAANCSKSSWTDYQKKRSPFLMLQCETIQQRHLLNFTAGTFFVWILTAGIFHALIDHRMLFTHTCLVFRRCCAYQRLRDLRDLSLPAAVWQQWRKPRQKKGVRITRPNWALGITEMRNNCFGKSTGSVKWKIFTISTFAQLVLQLIFFYLINQKRLNSTERLIIWNGTWKYNGRILYCTIKCS